MNQNSVSSTALTVMQGILYIAHHSEYHHLVPRELAETCQQMLLATDVGKKRFKALQSPWYRYCLMLKERLLLPGIALHYVMRKRFIEDYVRKQIQGGAKQVVNLGAGMDTLLSRLAEQYTDINFIEVDHPATQKEKRQALNDLRNHCENFHLMSVDFSIDDLSESLLNAKFFDKEASTIYIIEGVLMYLDLDNVQKTFRSLASIGNKEIKVVFTAAEPFSINPDTYGVLFSWYLKLHGEPLAWMCDKKTIRQAFSTFGFDVCEVCGAEGLKQRYLPESFDGDLQQVEYIAVATPK